MNDNNHYSAVTLSENRAVHENFTAVRQNGA